MKINNKLYINLYITNYINSINNYITNCITNYIINISIISIINISIISITNILSVDISITKKVISMDYYNNKWYLNQVTMVYWLINYYYNQDNVI